MKHTITLMISLLSMNLLAEPQVVRLYDGPAPGSENWKQEEKENRQNLWQTRVVYNVANPTLTLLLPPPSIATGAAAVICPGGGFFALSIDSEGLDVARWLTDKGVACFVLKYRLVECHTDDPTKEITSRGRLDDIVAPVVKLAAADGKAAVAYVRLHAKDFGINPDRIGIIGFSAGGTVAAAVGFGYEPASRPDFVAPIYLQYDWTGKPPVPADAPPMFILAASDDLLGLAPHSVALYTDWTKARKSAELHLLAKGGHGFGMRKQNLPSDHWIELFADWLAGQGFLKTATASPPFKP
jgi:acetyl esterase/lipase